MAHIDTIFGENVFNDAVMRQRLPKETYKALHKTIDDGRRLDPQVASVVAGVLQLSDHRNAAKPYGASFFCKNF